jgi:two-component sensor histidine kinase
MEGVGANGGHAEQDRRALAEWCTGLRHLRTVAVLCRSCLILQTNVYRSRVDDTAARHLRLLSDVVAAVTATLDLDETLQRVASTMASALQADACFVYVLDEHRDELVLGASVGVVVLGPEAPRMKVGEGLTGVAARARSPLAIDRDAKGDPRFKSFSNLDEDAYESFLAVPILARERLVGALNVRTLIPRPWTPDEVELVATIAAQVGQAIENAKLYGRSQQRIAELEALDRIARSMLAPLDLDEALRDALTTAAHAARADLCAIALSPAPGAPLEIAYRSSDAGPPDDVLADAASRAPHDAPGLLAVPLETRRGRLGALVCARPQSQPFTRADRALIRSIAAQTASGVAGARGAMRGLLAQEIHHRVKNNLQTVASLLRLAASGDADPHRALRDSVSRVLSIAEVHDLLTSTREDDVDGADLVQRLADMLRQTLGARGVRSELTPVVLPAARATALALVFCELFSNALEHGGGDVEVTLQRSNGFAELSVRDHGSGPSTVGANGRGQGLSIARALAESDLAGSLAFGDASPGVRGVVRFPLTWEGA